MKKTVRVLLVEPKPSILELMKNAVLSKPDQNYEFQIVATANTAKAAYFVMYKHHPHILFLNPDLPDEEGSSFIQHALERMPYLKIIGVASMFREEEMLEAGAHAFIPIPIQKTQIWRKIDEIVAELDEIGLLEVEHQEEEVVQDDTVELFEFEDPKENPEYTPLFEDLFKKTEENSQENKRVEPVILDDDVILVSLDGNKEQDFETYREETMLDNDESSTTQEEKQDEAIKIQQPKEEGFIEDVPSDLSATAAAVEEKEKEKTVQDDKKEDLFDFFTLDVEKEKDEAKPEPEEKSNPTSGFNDLSSLFDFCEVKIDKSDKTENQKDKTLDDELLSLFRFGKETPNEETGAGKEEAKPEKKEQTAQEPHTDDKNNLEKESETSPLFVLDEIKSDEAEQTQDENLHPEERKEKEITHSLPQQEKEESPKEEPLFSFDVEDRVKPRDKKITQEEKLKRISRNVPDSLQETFKPLPNTFTFKDKQKVSRSEIKREKPPLFELDMEKEPVKESGRERVKMVKEIETPVISRIQPDSNTTKHPDHLYSGVNEYNESTIPKRVMYQAGYYNRYKQFVPLYPPREQFPRVETESFSRMDKKKEVLDDHDSDSGPFSIFKKLFK